MKPHIVRRTRHLLTLILATAVAFAGTILAQSPAGPLVKGVSPDEAAVRVVSVPAPQGGMVRLSGHVPGKVDTGAAIRLDHYDSEKKLRLAIFVTPPDLAGEEKFLDELQTKSSPNFHKFLSAAEWNARFGPKVEDEQAVVDWATSQGFTVTNRYDNRLLVDVEAPVGVIERALGVTINHYRVDDEVDFSNDRDPLIPARLSGIVGGIFGLNSIERIHPAAGKSHEVRGPDYAPGPVHNERGTSRGEGDPAKAPWNRKPGENSRADDPVALSDKAPHSSPAANLRKVEPNDSGVTLTVANPSDIFSSYAYDYSALYAQSKCCNVPNASTGSPAASSIALAIFGGYLDSDVTTFFNHYGMAWNITSYSINGAGGIPGTDCNLSDPGCSSDDLDDEAPLDVEYSTAFSNSFGSPNDTAHVYVYEGANDDQDTLFDVWNSILNDGNAKVVSTSYGVEETAYWPGYVAGTAVGDAHYIFNQMVGEGLTLVAAAGDQGSTPSCGDAIGVIYPSSDPDFVAAGGTSLTLNTDGTFYGEFAWTGGPTLTECQNNGGGGGGGLSVMFNAPSWQNGISYEVTVNRTQQTVSGNTQRKLPDLSLEAGGPTNQWYYCSTGCMNVDPNGWDAAGGTSIVAPELAGFFAQENSYLSSLGSICGQGGTSDCEPIGNAAPILYYEGMGHGAEHNPFYDTTQGCVTNALTIAYSSVNYYCAETGYDLATGWGSANMLQLAWAYNFYIVPSDGVPSVTFSGPATNTWYNQDQVVSWSVSDGVTGGTAGLPPPGVAGFTDGWDSIPADPKSEPNGGVGNSFYSGPQYLYASGGCLSFAGAGGCANGPAQGCHTVHVDAWDNQGSSTGDQTYGPICYDTVAPTITASTNPPTSGEIWVDKAVTVTLTATDPGGTNASGIKATYYSIDNSNCTPGDLGACATYTGPFTQASTGQHFIYYFTEDNAGNFSTETYFFTSIDENAPVTTTTTTGDLQSGVYYSPVSITLNATDTGGSGVSKTYFILDSGQQTTYGGSPINVFANGSHNLKYWSVDVAGNVEAAHLFFFKIAPDTATTLSAPSAGTTLTGPSVTFSWPSAAGANGYFLHVGTTGVGSDNLLNSREYTASATSVILTNLPVTGGTIYARIFTDYNGNHVFRDYTFTAAAQAGLTSPTASTRLPGPSVPFTWSAATGSVNGYFLHVGSTGVGSDNLLNSPEYSASTTSVTVNGLPTAGGMIYVRLFTDYNGTHVYQDYTYTAATQATLSAPSLTAILPGPSATFSWASASGSVNGYFLHVGTTGVGSFDLLNSSEFSTSTTEATVNNLPTTGGRIYVRLFTDYNGTHVYQDYTFTAATEAMLNYPTQGGTFSGSSMTFEWNPATGSNIKGYFLHIGTTGVGSMDILNSAEYPSNTTSVTVNNLPTTGGTIYVRLFTDYNGTHIYKDYTFTAAN